MASPKISWYAKLLSDERYSVDHRFYAGKYTDNDQIVVDIQLWNNRWGSTTVNDLKDYDICFFFDRVEDSALLDMCTIVYNNANTVSFNVSGRKAILQMDDKPVLKGTKNNGSSADNPNNFMQLRFIFDASGERLKDNDLKSLYFEVLER